MRIICRQCGLPFTTKIVSLNICAYCGDFAEHIEHVVPKNTKLPTYTVPACAECNLMASGTLFGSFQAKANYIKSRIKKKYKKELLMPEWDGEELAEMSYSMAEKIKASQAFKKAIIRRLDWNCFFAKLDSE